jgi:hypothetical protein
VAALVILRAVLSAAKDMFRLWKSKDRAVASRPSKNPEIIATFQTPELS